MCSIRKLSLNFQLTLIHGHLLLKSYAFEHLPWYKIWLTSVQLHGLPLF